MGCNDREGALHVPSQCFVKSFRELLLITHCLKVSPRPPEGVLGDEGTCGHWTVYFSKGRRGLGALVLGHYSHTLSP